MGFPRPWDTSRRKEREQRQSQFEEEMGYRQDQLQLQRHQFNVMQNAMKQDKMMGFYQQNFGAGAGASAEETIDAQVQESYWNTYLPNVLKSQMPKGFKIASAEEYATNPGEFLQTAVDAISEIKTPKAPPKFGEGFKDFNLQTINPSHWAMQEYEASKKQIGSEAKYRITMPNIQAAEEQKLLLNELRVASHLPPLPMLTEKEKQLMLGGGQPPPPPETEQPQGPGFLGSIAAWFQAQDAEKAAERARRAEALKAKTNRPIEETDEEMKARIAREQFRQYTPGPGR